MCYIHASAVHLRETGLSNKQIAQRMGVCYLTVLNHLGKQPKEMSLINRRAGQEKRKIDMSARKEIVASGLRKEIADLNTQIAILLQKQKELESKLLKIAG